MHSLQNRLNIYLGVMVEHKGDDEGVACGVWVWVSE